MPLHGFVNRIHKVTGLMWQRSLPATYTGCSGLYASDSGQVGDACSWVDAKSYCAGLSLAGHSDWRLPSKIELESIVDETKANPAIDTAAFPSTPAVAFWTTSPSALGNWAVMFSRGNSFYYDPTNTYRVRCVR